MGAPPVNGSKTMGKSAVAEMGRASDNHQLAIQSVEAKTALASEESSVKGLPKKTRQNKMGPIASPILFLIIRED